MGRLRSLPQYVTIDVHLDEPADEGHLRAKIARQLGMDAAQLPPVELRKKALDARRGIVRFHLVFELSKETTPRDLGAPHPRAVGDPSRVVIVGDGPAGLFCAYELARHGIGATIVDRGKLVQPRRRDLKGLNRRGEVNENSNYCFGEGGAGTYSDGKLYTRSHKRGSVRDVIEILARHGAPDAILTDARPHIGSNKLPKVVTAIRETLERAGSAFRFDGRVVDLILSADGNDRRVRGIVLADGSEMIAEHVVLATGHSAADVYRLLDARGARLEAKPFALGVRVEHPQPLINEIQYGRAAGHRVLPAAAYRLATTVEERGVFSFCMCPGGWVVPATTMPDAVVVNGMSLSKRNSPYANSGLVVAVEPNDVERAGFGGVHGGVELQHAIERHAFRAGGGALRAPATRLDDFLARRASSTLPKSSYIPGLAATDIADVLDGSGLHLADRLRRAALDFERHLRGFITAEAVLIGVETRTSSPIRIVRDAESFEAVGIRDLYPCGEGAGYAGGIMSAAMDGISVAKKIAERMQV